ncbi:MAG TPA: ATP-dependent DNA helicase [Candidatus Dormibacteraeota bacterium]|nr:ATP-dependent DNA helicase [Candidatus Dormibacteraeota bacterium]
MIGDRVVIGARPSAEPTPEQRAAIEAGPDGAFLIAAGPGTGKTFTMVRRFLWLVEQGADPEAVLAVTFTEAAAGELRERLSQELRRPLEEAWIGTFHGICARLLREDAYLVGIPREVRVLDELGQRLIVERLQARLRSGDQPGLDREFEALSPDEVADLVQHGLTFALKLKGRGVLPDEFRSRALEIHRRRGAADAAARAELEAIEVLHTVYSAYQSWLREAGRMDFDDLILAVIEALRTNPDFRSRCRRRFRHILVDEFQDTNRIQLELVQLLAAPEFGNVTVVGDAKQSIYGWRDADIENIRTRFPGRRLPLTVNRRSVQEILDLATDFIRRDPDFASEPDLVAARADVGARPGPPISVMMAADARREARLVAGEIRRLVEEGRRFSEIAVLAHSVKLLPREFEEELRAHDIPYLTVGGAGFFDREEVKDVLALVRLVADPMDDAALVRVLQGPVVRMGDREMYRLACRRIGRWGMRLRDCLDAARGEGWPELSPATARRTERMLEVVDGVAAVRDGLTVADLLNRLLEESGYLRHCQVRSRREGPRPLHNLRQVFQMAERFERDSPLAGIAQFAGYLDRVAGAMVPVAEAEAQAAQAVHLSTIHGAKGLEFPVVFLVNLRPPNPRDQERYFFDPEELGFVMKYWRQGRHPRFKEHAPGARTVTLARQERRRAVYVALTRARDLLYVSASRPEPRPEEVDLEEDDHFAEILRWALDHPRAARVVQAEQLPLPVARRGPGAGAPAPVAELIARLELLARSDRGPEAVAGPPPSLRLSFTQLHEYEVCPVRYRFRYVWQVPAPPDELLDQREGGPGHGAAELGVAVHRALAAWHAIGGDLLDLYRGPDEGREMLAAYLAHPLAHAPTSGTEVEFSLRLEDGIRLSGAVDRVCRVDGATTLVDYKTNARLDDRLRAVYAGQLRIYGLAAGRGLVRGAPAGADLRLVLFDLRRGEAIEVRPDPAGAEARVREVARRVAAGDFRLGPEHDDRPCGLCAYRPLCTERR